MAGSGLLLATKDCENREQPCHSFHTYFIVADGASIKIAASELGLLVPRKDGFYWVGYDKGASDRYEEISQEVSAKVRNEEEVRETLPEPERLWAVRAGEQPIFPRSDSKTLPDFYTDLEHYSVDLTFVGTDYVAGKENEEHVGVAISYANSSWIVTLNSLAKGDRNAAFTLSGPRYDAAVKRCKRELLAEGGDFNTPDFLDSAEQYPWVRRGNTFWQLGLTFTYSSGAARGYETECELPHQFLAAIVGWDTVEVNWSAIKQALPAAQTAFESPQRDVVLIFDSKSLNAYALEGAKLGKFIGKVTIAGVPVMSQWASGPSVSRWSHEVADFLKVGPPTLRYSEPSPAPQR